MSWVLQCVAVCCSMLQCVILCFRVLHVLQCVAVYYRVLSRVAVRCSVLQCIIVHCSALQCIAVHCSALQCVSVCHRVSQTITTNHDICQIPGLLSSAEDVLLGCQSWDVSNSSFTPRSLHSTQVCGSVLQYIAVCCSALQSVAECCRVTGWRRLIGSPKSQIIFHKEPLNIGHFCRKWPLKIRDPMSLRHPVSVIACIQFSVHPTQSAQHTGVLQCVAVYCSVQECVAECCWAVSYGIYQTYPYSCWTTHLYMSCRPNPYVNTPHIPWPLIWCLK